MTLSNCSLVYNPLSAASSAGMVSCSSSVPEAPALRMRSMQMLRSSVMLYALGLRTESSVSLEFQSFR